MNPRPNYCQLAVTTFEETKAFRQAFTGLLDAGLDLHQICLVAFEPAMARLLSDHAAADGSDNRFADLALRLVEAPGHPGQSKLVTTSLPLFDALLTAERTTGRLAQPFRGSYRVQLDVRSQLHDGHIALIAYTTDASQHQDVVKNLLARSTSTVTTHQVPFVTE